MKKRDWGNSISFTLGITIMWIGTNIISSQFITYLGLLVSILYGIELLKEDQDGEGK